MIVIIIVAMIIVIAVMIVVMIVVVRAFNPGTVVSIVSHSVACHDVATTADFIPSVCVVVPPVRVTVLTTVILTKRTFKAHEVYGPCAVWP